MAGHVEQRRQHGAVELHLVVDSALDHAGNADGGPGVGGFAGAHQARVELAQLQHRRALAGGVRIGHFGFEHAMAHQLFIFFGVGLASTTASSRMEAGMSMGSGSGSTAGMSKTVPSPKMPTARTSASLPSVSAAASISSSAKPQA
jgi:hypothetical protein